MKMLIQRIAAGTGFIMLIATPAIASNAEVVPAWLLSAAALLLAGRAFTFQQN